MFDPVNGATLRKVLTARYQELALAADLKWEWQELLIQSDVIANERAYLDELRPVSVTLPGVPPSFVPDVRSRGFYVLTAYRTPWWNIMPFVVWQMYDDPLVADVNEVQLALNVRVLPEIVLKGQFNHVWFPGSIGSAHRRGRPWCSDSPSAPARFNPAPPRRRAATRAPRACPGASQTRARP